MSTFPKVVFAVALLLVGGCASFTRESAPELSCEGPITESTSRADLLAIFGTENVRDMEIEIGEGETSDGTVIYPDDPSRRIEVVWVNPMRKSRISSVRVSEPSDWSVEGLSAGLDLRHVERLNRRPFSLYGFDWDYAGTTASWNGGVFDGDTRCRLLARFRPSEEESSDREVSGEETFASDDPRMRELNPTIYELLLIFE